MMRVRTTLVCCAAVVTLLGLVGTPVSAQAEPRKTDNDAGSLLAASGPTEVPGGEPYLVTFTATHDGEPLPGVSVSVERRRYTDHEYALTLESTTAYVTDARGEVAIELEAGAADYYEFKAAAELPDGWRNVTHTVNVERPSSVLTPDPIPHRVTPGDPVEIPVTLTTVDGEPLAGQQIEFEVRHEHNYYYPMRWTATTDEQGRASFVETSEAPGTYYSRFSYAGAAQLDDAVVLRGFGRAPAPTVLTVNAPESGVAGEPITVEGTLLPAEGPVTIELDHNASGDVVTTPTDESGAWSAEVVPLPGPNLWAVSFPGTTRQAASSTSFTLTTPKAVTSFEDITVQYAAAGENYRLSGRITPSVGTTSLAVSWDGVPPRRFTVSGDSFTVFDRSPPTSGTHTLRLSYAGDYRNLPATEEVLVDVAKGDPGFTVHAGEEGVEPGELFIAQGHVMNDTARSTYVDVVAPDGQQKRVPIQVRYGVPFSIPLRAPAAPGTTATWTVTFPGDVHHTAETDTFSVYVKKPHDVTFRHRPNPITIGQQMELRVGVPGASEVEVRIVARDPAGTLVRRWEGTLSWRYDYEHVAPLDTALRLTATVQADSRHTATTRTYVVRPRRAVTTQLRGKHDQGGDYAVYDVSRHPRLVSRVQPAPSCVRQRVQAMTRSGWQTVSSACRTTSTEGTASIRFGGTHKAGSRYRVRSVVPDTKWYQRSPSAWHYFRFRA